MDGASTATGAVEALRDQIAALAKANAAADRAVAALLELSGGLAAGDRAGAELLFDAAHALGRCEQARHGQLIRVLAQAERVAARRGALKPWIATRLDVSDGRARGIAQAAVRLGAVEELAEPLASGRVGADTVKTLSRAARAIRGSGRDKAATLAGVLQVAQSEGVGAANRAVRELEHELDPAASRELLARQRERSFARIIELEDGRCRVEALLDPVRATTLRAALDQITSGWIRARQYDHTQPLPADVRSTDQLNAAALVHLAEVFLSGGAARQRAFSPTVLYFAALGQARGGLAATAYGTLVPASALPEPGQAGARLLEVDEQGEPVALDGAPLDRDPGARLASPQQRVALAWRDRHCTHAGCSRPATWSLHAHHRIPYHAGGQTRVKNLLLLCAEHHVQTHHPRQ